MHEHQKGALIVRLYPKDHSSADTCMLRAFIQKVIIFIKGVRNLNPVNRNPATDYNRREEKQEPTNYKHQTSQKEHKPKIKQKLKTEKITRKALQ